MVDFKDIKQNLINLGLSSDEANVYVHLLNLKSDSVYKISQAVHEPRTNVYRICQSLVDKNFCEWVVVDKSKQIKALHPKQLDFLKIQKESELEVISQSLNNLEKMINIDVLGAAKTEVRYYQGAEGMKQMMWNSLKAKDITFGYSQFGRVDIVGRKFIDKWTDEFRLRGLKDFVITNEKYLDYIVKNIMPEDTKHQLTTENIRVITSDLFYVSGDTTIYNNTYAACYWDRGEIVGVEIENSEIVKMQKSIFDLLWKLGKGVGEFGV